MVHDTTGHDGAAPRWLIAALVPSLCGLSGAGLVAWAVVIILGAGCTALWRRRSGEPPEDLPLQWIALGFAGGFTPMPALAPAACGTLAGDWRSCLLVLVAGAGLSMVRLPTVAEESGGLLIACALILAFLSGGEEAVSEPYPGPGAAEEETP